MAQGGKSVDKSTCAHFSSIKCEISDYIIIFVAGFTIDNYD